MKKVWLTSLSVLTAFIFLTNAAVAGNLVIKGSTTVLPIALKVAEAYMKEHPSGFKRRHPVEATRKNASGFCGQCFP